MANFSKATEKALLVDKQKVIAEMRALIAQEDARLLVIQKADEARLASKREARAEALADVA